MITRLKEIAYDTVAKKFITRDDHGRKIEVPIGSSPDVGKLAVVYKSGSDIPFAGNPGTDLTFDPDYIVGELPVSFSEDNTQIRVSPGIYDITLTYLVSSPGAASGVARVRWFGNSDITNPWTDEVDRPLNMPSALDVIEDWHLPAMHLRDSDDYIAFRLVGMSPVGNPKFVNNNCMVLIRKIG